MLKKDHLEAAFYLNYVFVWLLMALVYMGYSNFHKRIIVFMLDA